MPRGGNRDSRETFVVDTLRLRDKGSVPPAPNKGAIEFYCRQQNIYWLDDQGVEHQFGGVGVSASPGFTWGRTGSVGVGAYLLNDEVPSNVTGRVITFADPVIRKILVTNGAVSTFTITIQEHDGTTYTDLTTVSLTAQRETTATVNVPITSGKQLAIKVSSGLANNPVVGIILDGVF
jgi:hypothetical protein